MEELSIEEKVKAYDKVREKIELRFGSNVAEEIFSEFEESKDERIRKCLIDFFEDWHKNRSHCYGIAVTDILSWLEKPGELKPKAPAVFNKMLDRQLTDYHSLSVRTLYCLKAANINTLRELVRLTENSLLSIPHLGNKSLVELKDFVKIQNLTWGMNV